MGTMNHFSFGWLTPTLSYLMACAGAALGLRCTLRALAATGTARRNWLLTAAAAIGSGIWTMHFVAMFGFSVDGTELRYDVPLTILSLLVAVLVVGLGVFTVGYGRHRGRSLLLGGLTTGVGVAAMHYLGMAAVLIHGRITYRPGTVGLSVLVAVAAATAALWAAVTIRTMLAAGGAALVMGVAVSCMHYTGMAAVQVQMEPARTELGGATPMQFIFPLAVGLGSFLFLTSAFVALSPSAQERAAYREAGELAVEDLRRAA
ncbi:MULTISPECIES: MHYT domain-containing protein [Kitasatospora]|uniref:NO-binding membrane sensor protein with MHYT domain n=2 Tax=Kitasatospora TaxID=2063 RepID=A0ABT1ITH7_9ACTN|nr:MHYT domain-containing protein [Kitasatospora paracochleata]MCP2308440.1 NO-binding membrane sensor protein with MHYT domain [Kitasatospora paracochleata]